MFRTLLLTLLALSLISGANANDIITLPVIAAYDFETLKTNQWGNQYILGWGSNEAPAYLHEAEITNEGKYGKSLAIDPKGWIKCVMNHPPLVSGNAVSFVAWIKIDMAENSAPFYLAFQGFGANSGSSSRIFEIQPSGALRLTAFYAVPPPDLGAVFFEIKSEDQDIIDFNWHHIAYSQYLGIHRFFVDGKIVFQQKDDAPAIDGGFTSVSIGTLRSIFRGTAFIDDAGVFGVGLSEQSIQTIYNEPLSNFINAMPVDPQDKIATTWAFLRRR